MSENKSPELPRPKQLVKVAENLLNKQKKEILARTPEQAEEADLNERAEGEFRFFAESSDPYTQRVVRDVESIIHRTKTLSQPEHLPDEHECEEILKRFNDLRKALGDKLQTDNLTKIAASSNKSGGAGEVYYRTIDLLEVGQVTFEYDKGGAEDGTLRVSFDQSVATNYGEEKMEMTHMATIRPNEVVISDTDVDQGKRHFITRDPERNELDKTTPKVVKITETLINSYLDYKP